MKKATPKKKRQSKVEGNIVDFIRELTENKHELFSYFYWDSRFWRALRKYIEDTVDKGECAVLDSKPPKGYKLAYHRGTGSSISFKDAHTYAPNYDTKPPTPADNFCISLTVGFERDIDGEFEEREGRYYIGVPCHLENDELSDAAFKADFDRWIMSLSSKKETAERDKELPLLKELMEKYPLEAQALITEKPNELRQLIQRLNRAVGNDGH